MRTDEEVNLLLLNPSKQEGYQKKYRRGAFKFTLERDYKMIAEIFHNDLEKMLEQTMELAYIHAMRYDCSRALTNEELVEDRDIPFRMSCSYLEMSSNIRQKILERNQERTNDAR